MQSAAAVALMSLFIFSCTYQYIINLPTSPSAVATLHWKIQKCHMFVCTFCHGLYGSTSCCKSDYITLHYFIIITFTLLYITVRQSKNHVIPKNGVDHTIHCSKTSVHDGIDVHCNRTQHLTSSSSAQISSLKSSSHQRLHFTVLLTKLTRLLHYYKNKNWLQFLFIVKAVVDLDCVCV